MSTVFFVKNEKFAKVAYSSVVCRVKYDKAQKIPVDNDFLNPTSIEEQESTVCKFTYLCTCVAVTLTA